MVSLHIVLAVMRTETSAMVSGVFAPSDGITTGTVVHSSFTSVLVVASVSATSQVHHKLISCLLSTSTASYISQSELEFLLGF